MAEEGLRRSTRVRKAIKSYAAEQAKENEVDDAPPAKRIKTQSAEGDEDAITKAPAEKAKRKSTESDEEDQPPKAGAKRSTSTQSSWHADAAERRIAASNKVKKLAPGKEEKRLRPFVETAPKSYHDSLKRANSQRMFVLDRERGVDSNCHANHDDCPCEKVQIAGSTGNVYTVTITHKPTCTCPAGLFKRKGKETLCKHALYILHNVLKTPEHLKQQNAFLTSELKEIFANAPAMPSQVAEEDAEVDGRKSIEGDCPICFMEFEDGEDIVWCRAACGNNIHKTCFDQWARMKMRRVTCPFCRAEWEYDAPKPQKVNVAAVSLPTERGAGGYRNVRDQLDYD